jgi:phosphate transport system protein
MADGAGASSFLPPRHAVRDQEILWADFLAMASKVITAVQNSVEALCDGRLEFVREVKAAERELDREEVRIEQECLRILALYEPVASDLRRTATMLKVNRDLERIADLAARLARRARKLSRNTDAIVIPQALNKLAHDVHSRAVHCYDALKNRDNAAARSIIESDRDIDLQYRDLRKLLKNEIRQNPAQLNSWLQLMSAARNLERIADHATDIARMIVFMQEGVFLRQSSKKEAIDPILPPL